MNKDIKLGGLGAVLCPSCHYGMITKATDITFGVYEHGNTDAFAHCKCPYCGEIIAFEAGSKNVAYRFTNVDCILTKMIIVSK